MNKASLQVIFIIFLGEEQSSTINDALRNFKSDLCSIALLGTMYGDNRDGLMDYLESSGSYTAGGLKSYTMSAEMETAYGGQEAARLGMISQLVNVLINGN